MVCVRPGVLLVKASLCCPPRALIKLDFPTLLLPKNAISGRASEGNCSGLLALAKNSAINLTTTYLVNFVVRYPLSVFRQQRDTGLVGAVFDGRHSHIHGRWSGGHG